MIDIYCDESRPEVIFGDKGNLTSSNKFMLISGIWLDRFKRDSLKTAIKSVQVKHDTFGEIKWKNVSPSRLDFYKELIHLFFNSELRFRCILVDGTEFDSEKYHESDDELGFYKFYYQLIFHWLTPFENYSIFLDHKKNKFPNRLQTLQQVLSTSSLSFINRVQAIPSKESVLIQMTDLLMGAVSYKFHGLNTSPAKLELINCIESYLGHAIQWTYKTETKFNVFRMRLK